MESIELHQRLDEIEQLLAVGNSEEALAQLREMYETPMPSSSRGRAMALEVVGLEDQDRSAEAGKLIESTMKEDGDDLGFILAAGVQFSELDAVEHSEVFLRNLCQLDPENHLAWFNLGVALSRAGRHEESRHCYEQTLQRAPDFHEARLHEAFALRMEHQLEDALERYQQYVEKQPDDTEGWVGAAQVLSEMLRFDEAYAMFEEATNRNPELLDAWFDWAVTAVRAKDQATADRCVARMVEIDGEDWRTAIARADAAEMQGETWEAWESLTTAFDSFSEEENFDPEPFDFVGATMLRFAHRNKMLDYAAPYVERMYQYEPLSEELLDAMILTNERYSNAAASYQVVLKGSVPDETGHMLTAYRVYGVASENPDEAAHLGLAFESKCTGTAWQAFNVMQISPPDEGSLGVYWMSDLLDKPPSASPERT